MRVIKRYDMIRSTAYYDSVVEVVFGQHFRGAMFATARIIDVGDKTYVYSVIEESP